MERKGLIVDGNNLIHSSYHVSQKLSWKINNGTIFFFLRVLISILKKGNYEKLLIVFDGGGDNFRKNLIFEYKVNRKKMPEDLWEQMKIVKELLEEIGIKIICKLDFEADDIIASFVDQKKKQDPSMILDIFTRDKDLLQLLDENVSILKYIEGKSTIYTFQDFCKEYKFMPSNYVDYLSFLGDSSDNIKGIKGIGPVNSKKLIQEFQNIENVYQKIEILPEKIRKIIEGQKETACLNKKVIMLDKNIIFSQEEIEN